MDALGGGVEKVSPVPYVRHRMHLISRRGAEIAALLTHMSPVGGEGHAAAAASE